MARRGNCPLACLVLPGNVATKLEIEYSTDVKLASEVVGEGDPFIILHALLDSAATPIQYMPFAIRRLP